MPLGQLPSLGFLLMCGYTTSPVEAWRRHSLHPKLSAGRAGWGKARTLTRTHLLAFNFAFRSGQPLPGVHFQLVREEGGVPSTGTDRFGPRDFSWTWAGETELFCTVAALLEAYVSAYILTRSPYKAQ